MSEEYDLFHIVFQKDEQNRVAPLSTVLLQEVARFNRLLGVVNRSLRDLKKGVKGEIVMSQQLESVYLAFINNKVCIHPLEIF